MRNVVYNLIMLMAFFSWWYTKGWLARAEKLLDGLERSIDYFSLTLLLKTWFAPFRQIDAGRLVNASIEQRMRKFVDRTFSRFIGAFLRTLLLLYGVFWIFAKSVWSLVVLLVWLVLPILPILFVIMTFSGFTVDLPDLKAPEINWPQVTGGRR